MGKLLRLAISLLIVAAVLGADDIRTIAQVTNDIIYDSFSRKIYASVPSSAGLYGNSIMVIDPFSAATGPTVYIGSEPNKLALSHDGKYLYVGLDGAAAVRRFHIPTLTAGLQFTLGFDSYGAPYYVEDMKVLPANPDAVAVSRRDESFNSEGIAIYDNGVQRPVTTPAYDSGNLIEFSATASRLYGFNNESWQEQISRMSVDASGVSIIDAVGNVVPDYYDAVMAFDDGVLYFSPGQVFDPEKKLLKGTFSGISDDALVRPDSSVNRVFFLTYDSYASEKALLSFEQDSFLPLVSVDIYGLSGDASSLIRWDAEGLAFRSEYHVVLIRTSLIPKPGILFMGADTDGDGLDELVADLWTEGLWLWDAGWTMLSGRDPEKLAAADTDGSGDEEIVADFGPLGLWVWNSGIWNQITAENPDGFAAADTDGDAVAELAVDFKTLGSWLWDGGAWTQLTGADVDSMIGIDLNGSGDEELLVDAGSLGLWAWDGGSWSALSGSDAEGVVSAETDGFGDEEAVVDFGHLGVWLWNSGSWTQLSGLDADQLIVLDTDHDGISEVAGDFGLWGAWLWDGSWSRLTGSDAESLLAADADGDGGQEIIADFGSTGLWIWDGGWSQMSSLDPKALSAANTDADLADELVIDFGDTGVWLFDGGAWSKIR